MNVRPIAGVAVATVLLVLGSSCASGRGNPRSESNWNTGFVGESMSLHFLGANSYTPDTIEQSNRQGSRDQVLLFRRYFFNDNPDNPLQEHRYGPFDRYVPIWHMPVYGLGDLWDVTRSTLVDGFHGLVAIVLKPWQMTAGTSETSGVPAPPRPEDFKVKNP